MLPQKEDPLLLQRGLDLGQSHERSRHLELGRHFGHGHIGDGVVLVVDALGRSLDGLGGPSSHVRDQRLPVEAPQRGRQRRGLRFQRRQRTLIVSLLLVMRMVAVNASVVVSRRRFHFGMRVLFPLLLLQLLLMMLAVLLLLLLLLLLLMLHDGPRGRQQDTLYGLNGVLRGDVDVVVRRHRVRQGVRNHQHGIVVVVVLRRRRRISRRRNVHVHGDDIRGRRRLIRRGRL